MDLSVSDDILDQTTRCKKGFACLSEQQNTLCTVDYRSGRHCLHVNTRQRTECHYCVHFGPANRFCTCPVRVALYDRWGI